MLNPEITGKLSEKLKNNKPTVNQNEYEPGFYVWLARGRFAPVAYRG